MIMIRYVTVLLTIGFLAEDAGADATRVRLHSGDPRVSLVELFTSEGCSSCPPADRWLSSLQDDPGLWREFVPIAFHVDYWDYIGWRDRFASAQYSERQRRYAREGGVRVVYTPGVFRNGREWRDWHRDVPGPNVAVSPGALTLDIADGHVTVAFRPNLAHSGDFVAHLAVLGMGLESQVAAGENTGRTLRHNFVVLGVEAKALREVGDLHEAELALPRASVRAPRHAVVGWIATADRQAPIQAVGGFLPRAAD